VLINLFKPYILFFIVSTSILSAENCGCSIDFYINDTDTSGTNIRVAPGGTIVSKIPYAKESFHSIHAVEFKNGWWKIDYIELEDDTEKTVLNGWIHKSVLGVDLDDGEFIENKDGTIKCITPIYSKPTYTVKSGLFMSGNTDGKRILTGCYGKWLKIKQIVDNDTISGWWAPEDRCSNPLTNCINTRAGEMSGIDEWGNK
jgi:hypothetical protein